MTVKENAERQLSETLGLTPGASDATMLMLGARTRIERLQAEAERHRTEADKLAAARCDRHDLLAALDEARAVDVEAQDDIRRILDREARRVEELDAERAEVERLKKTRQIQSRDILATGEYVSGLVAENARVRAKLEEFRKAL